jgi:hypothetical protein
MRYLVYGTWGQLQMVARMTRKTRSMSIQILICEVRKGILITAKIDRRNVLLAIVLAANLV